MAFPFNETLHSSVIAFERFVNLLTTNLRQTHLYDGADPCDDVKLSIRVLQVVRGAGPASCSGKLSAFRVAVVVTDILPYPVVRFTTCRAQSLG